ncbi:MAG TPA: methyltransferase [Bacillus sp. (in: Bacteria)]|nr:methyltransferase [Bacillus sp. (in: firmicutes)]
MQNINSLCHQFAQILNGKPRISNGVCAVEIKRNLNVTIQGRPSHGVLNAEISFESLDYEGNALNLCETVILEEEIPAFTNILLRNGIIVSALHNHWLFTKPNILYIHFQSVEPPLNFARKVAEAFKVLK